MIIKEYSFFIDSFSLCLNLCAKTSQFFERVRSPYIDLFKIFNFFNQFCVGDNITVRFFGNVFNLLLLFFDIVLTCLLNLFNKLSLHFEFIFQRIFFKF